MNVIEVDNISKKFRLGAGAGDLREKMSALLSRRKQDEQNAAREFWALRDISFSVAEGESFGIIGHNGSGKSTLLKLITGIYKPTTGTFKMRGRVSALIEVGAGFHPDLTGRENVYLNGSVLGMKKREIDRRFDEIVAFAELEKFIDTPVKRYSSGMYMRLGFAVAAHVDPDIVLVDEVLAVGDESFQKKCMDKMLALRREGKTIVFISHNMDAMATLCSRIMLLSQGKMLAIGNPSETINTYRTSASLARLQRADLPSVNDLAMTSDMEFLEVRLLNNRGQECSEITQGDAVTLECRFRANIPIEEPAFGVALYRADETYVYGFNTRYDGLNLRSVSGESVFRVTYDPLNLMQGAYYFNIGLCRAEDTHHPVASFPQAATLVVNATTLNQGLVSLPHTWDIPGDAAAAMEMPKMLELSH